MSADKYNLNALWKAFSTTSNETLTLSVFQGRASLVMFKKGTESRRPIVKFNLSLAACLKMVDIMKSLIDAQPETRVPFVQMSYNNESRSYEQATSFVFYKDDKRCYGIEIANKFLTTPVKILFKIPNTFTFSGDSMSEEQKSLLGVREFIVVLQDQIPQALLLSRYGMENLNGGNGGGRRGGNRNNATGGSESGGYREESVFG